MTAPNRARPCPLCEAASDDQVVGLYRERAFEEHVLRAHPGFDPASCWAMPLPAAAPRRGSHR